MDQLKAELARKCQVCYFQSQEVQKLRMEVKETELLSMENESLTVCSKRRPVYRERGRIRLNELTRINMCDKLAEGEGNGAFIERGGELRYRFRADEKCLART